MKTLIFAFFLTLAVLAAVLFFLQPAKANAPNTVARIASSSPMAVGPQAVITLFTTSNTGGTPNLCASRIVSTVASPVMLSFASNFTPTGALGVLQPASTTVSYSADQYGCGAVTAYGFSSTTITVAEARW